MKEQNESYRASVAGIIVNKNKDFLFVQLKDARVDEWDFTKGGMVKGETEVETLKREILEELGNEFISEIVKRSDWAIVYDWPKELQIRKGFKGQARVNYWVLYKEGEPKIKEDEIRSYMWVNEKDVRKILIQSGFPKFHCDMFELDWEYFKKENQSFFE